MAPFCYWIQNNFRHGGRFAVFFSLCSHVRRFRSLYVFLSPLGRRTWPNWQRPLHANMNYSFAAFWSWDGYLTTLREVWRTKHTVCRLFFERFCESLKGLLSNACIYSQVLLSLSRIPEMVGWIYCPVEVCESAALPFSSSIVGDIFILCFGQKRYGVRSLPSSMPIYRRTGRATRSKRDTITFQFFVRVNHTIWGYCENVLSKDPVSSVESDKMVLILLVTESCLCICETKQKTHLKQLRVNSRKSRCRQARMLDAIRPGAMRQSWMHFRSWCEL